MKYKFLTTFLFLFSSAFIFSQDITYDLEYYLKKYPEKNRSRFEKEIQAFERLDEIKKYPEKSILFIGSSSIRLWKNLNEVMNPYNVIHRGYGGAHFRDLIFYTDRILNNHSLSMIVCFVANDIKGLEDVYNKNNERDGTPEEIAALYDFFVKQVRVKYPEIPIVQIEITPTSSRWKLWSKISEVNNLIKEYCLNNENLFYIETADLFLNDNGTPNNKLFVKDLLHLNKEGYMIWDKVVKDRIDLIFKK